MTRDDPPSGRSTMELDTGKSLRSSEGVKGSSMDHEHHESIRKQCFDTCCDDLHVFCMFCCEPPGED